MSAILMFVYAYVIFWAIIVFDTLKFLHTKGADVL